MADKVPVDRHTCFDECTGLDGHHPALYSWVPRVGEPVLRKEAAMTTGQGEAASVIEALSEEYARSINRGDPDWLVDRFYAPEAYFMPPGREMARGTDQLRAVIGGMLEAGIGDFGMQTEKIEAVGDLAYRIGRFTLGKPSPERGKFIEVYRRQADGTWKCVGDIFNSDQDAT
jgi:ketosteroid isomerase-like protein